MGRDFLFDWLTDCFRDLLIGRNVKGIVHNLNGPLQILSMQLELLNMDLDRCKSDVMDMKQSAVPSPDRCSRVSELLLKTAERIAQLQEVVQKVDSSLRVVGLRAGAESSDNVVPVILNQLISEELEFWKSDLFFKHQVALSLDLPETSPVVTVRERVVRDIFDSVLLACIEQVRSSSSKPSITLRCTPVDAKGFVLEFVHNGPAFDTDELQACAAASENRLIPSDISKAAMALYMAEGWSRLVGMEISITGSGVSIASGTAAPD